MSFCDGVSCGHVSLCLDVLGQPVHTLTQRFTHELCRGCSFADGGCNSRIASAIIVEHAGLGTAHAWVYRFHNLTLSFRYSDNALQSFSFPSKTATICLIAYFGLMWITFTCGRTKSDYFTHPSNMASTIQTTLCKTFHFFP